MIQPDASLNYALVEVLTSAKQYYYYWNTISLIAEYKCSTESNKSQQTLCHLESALFVTLIVSLW